MAGRVTGNVQIKWPNLFHAFPSFLPDFFIPSIAKSIYYRSKISAAYAYSQIAYGKPYARLFNYLIWWC